MDINDATRKRILQLCDKRNLSINGLSTVSSLTQSTLDSFMRNPNSTTTLETMEKVCSGLRISIADFFDDNIFR